MWKNESNWLTSGSWLMLPEVSLLTRLTKERIWQNYLFPGPGVGAGSIPSHFMICQLMAAGCARQMDWEDVNPLSSGEDSKLQDHVNVHAFRLCSSLQGNLEMPFCSHSKVSNLLISTAPEGRDPALLCSWTNMPSQESWCIIPGCLGITHCAIPEPGYFLSRLSSGGSHWLS